MLDLECYQDTCIVHVWVFIALEKELQYFAALTTITSLLTEIDQMLALETEASDALLLVSSSSIVGMLFFQTLEKFAMLFLSNSDRGEKFVMP